MPADGAAQREMFQGQKRSSETEVEDLEKEIKSGVDEDGDTNMDMIASLGLFWSHGGGGAVDFPTLTNLISATPATTPDTFDEYIFSIEFLHGGASVCEKVKLCDKGLHMRLWMTPRLSS